MDKSIKDFVRKWDGRTITEPGIYSDVPIEDYHHKTDLFDGPSISSSGVRGIVGPDGCLLKFWDGYYLNPDRAPQRQKDHFNYGHALHHLSAGEKGFFQKFAIRPEEFDSYRTNAAKAWRDDAIQNGQKVITLATMESLRRCGEQLTAHPTIQAGILRGLVEHTIVFKVRVLLSPEAAEAYGSPFVDVWVKCRPDVIPLDSLLVADLKSTADASPIGCRRAITDYGYHIQMAMIMEALLAVTGLTFNEFVLVFIESARPHCINLKPLSAFTMQVGRMFFRKGLNMFANAWALKSWPTYEDDEVEGGLMPYAADAIAKQIEAGELPAIEPLMMADDNPHIDDGDEESV